MLLSKVALQRFVVLKVMILDAVLFTYVAGVVLLHKMLEDIVLWGETRGQCFMVTEPSESEGEWQCILCQRRGARKTRTTDAGLIPFHPLHTRALLTPWQYRPFALSGRSSCAPGTAR